jgi:DNA polymerase III subunit alpha
MKGLIFDMDFVHLHNHTDGSLQDGLMTPSRMIQRVIKLQQQAVAITDHGSLCNTIEFLSAIQEPFKKPNPPSDGNDVNANKTYKKELQEYNQYKDVKIKPIIGIEGYLCRNMHSKIQTQNSEENATTHIVLLAKTQKGYENLVELSTASYIDGFYRKPRIDYSLLKKHSEGIIGLSACIQGFICQELKHRGPEKASKMLEEAVEIFDGDFYVELMYHGLEEEDDLMRGIIPLAQNLNIPLVATNDAHYTTQAEAFAQKILICIQTRTTINDPSGMAPEDGHEDFYLKSGDEMFEAMKQLTDEKTAISAIENTLEVADKVDFVLDISNDVEFPKIELLEREKENFDTWHSKYLQDRPQTQAYLAYLVMEGLKEKGLANKNEYIQRVKKELKAIYSSGFTAYFLMTKRICDYAHHNKIRVGPGRGSGAGSLCCYALNITKIDPIEYGLMFERFLNMGRQNKYDFNFEEYTIKEWQKKEVE